MTWNERKPGWVGRPRPRPDPLPLPTQSAPGDVAAVIIVPVLPMFSPAAVADVLKVNRGMVHYYLEKGKLEFLRDNIGERYVLRDELIRFVREYLGKAVQV